MRWLIVPLLAAMTLGVSGFLNELEETTIASVELADAGRDAAELPATFARLAVALPRRVPRLAAEKL